MNSIGQRIKHYRELKGWSQAKLAREAGVSQSAIATLERDPTRQPREVIPIANALGINPVELMTGKPLVTGGIDSASGPTAIRQPAGNITSPPRAIEAWEDGDPLDEDEVEVKRLTLKMSAGTGRLQWEVEEHGSKNRFRLSWCKRKGIKPEGLVTLYVDGDSMSPTLPEGASITIYTLNTALRNGKVHAIDFHGEFYVKRLFRQASGGVLIRSDNPDKTRHPDWEVSPEHVGAIRILGSVESVSADVV